MPGRPAYWKSGGLTDLSVLNQDIADGTITNNKISSGTLENDKLSDNTIQSNKIDFFLSGEITGNTSEQSTAHGLGRTPSVVIVFPTKGGGITELLSISEGSHDSTNIYVTAFVTTKYRIFAF